MKLCLIDIDYLVPFIIIFPLVDRPEYYEHHLTLLMDDNITFIPSNIKKDVIIAIGAMSTYVLVAKIEGTQSSV